MPRHNQGYLSMSPNLPPLHDHAFMKLIRKRCEDMSRSMEEISGELGCTADELCRWIMAYREPKKRPSQDTTKYGPPIAVSGAAIKSHRHLAQQYEVWKRQHDGVIATREAQNG